MDIRFEMRRKRDDLGMSRREMAEHIGCHMSHLEKMEIGDKRFLGHWVERINKVYKDRN